MFRILADATVMLHLLFIAFMVMGGALALRWPRVGWVHLPLAAWGVVVQWMSWTCPLTPLENWFRASARVPTYSAGFVEHYLLPILYPLALGPRFHLALGFVVLAVNAGVYGVLLGRSVRARRSRRPV